MSRSTNNPIKTGDLVTVRGLPRSGVGIVIRLFVRDLSYGAGGAGAIRYLVADVMWARGDRTEMMVDNLALVDDVLGDM
jgi:hypothetical protein